jgi:hypothetical protein
MPPFRMRAHSSSLFVGAHIWKHNGFLPVAGSRKRVHPLVGAGVHAVKGNHESTSHICTGRRGDRVGTGSGQ